MNYIVSIIKGIFIGAGAIVPGVSSGVLCVIFGIYEKLLDAVLGFFKEIKKNIKFLLPIGIGILIGILLFSNLLNYLLSEFPVHTKSIFIGLILGTVPALFKEVNSKEKFKIQNVAYMIIALGVGLGSVILEKKINVVYIEQFSNVYLIICGLVMSLGIIIPGVSSTIILMLFGVYPIYLQSIANMYLPVLIPIVIGAVCGCIIVMKITKMLLNRHYGKTFYSIIGFTLGSILVLFPQHINMIEMIISFLCIILGIIISNSLTVTTKSC